MLSNISLEKLQDHDIKLIAIWLNIPHVKKWYLNPADWFNEIHQRHDDFSFIHHFIAYANQQPIGFCQYYDCFRAQENWYEINYPDMTFSIDYMIAETAYLKQGYGKQMINALINDMKQAIKSPFEIIVQPDKENTASCNTLLSCNFIFDDDFQYYRLFLS